MDREQEAEGPVYKGWSLVDPDCLCYLAWFKGIIGYEPQGKYMGQELVPPK